MLAALLLAAWLAPAAPDWVEISQQHYRKPVRTHYFPNAEDKPVRPTFYSTEEEETRLPINYPMDDIRHAPTQNPVRLTPTHINSDVRFVENEISKGDRRVYSNHSISEHNWNQNKYQISGNVKRVDSNFKFKPNVTPEFSLEIYEQVTETKPEQNSKQKDQKSVSATIERVPNKGSIKRVQLSNTPVKSPSVTNAVTPIRRSDIRQYGSIPIQGGLSDELEIKPEDIFNNGQEEMTTLTPINHIKYFFSSTKETPIRNFDRTIPSTGWPSKHPQTQYIQKSDTTTKTNNMEKDWTNISNFKNISAIKENPVSNPNIKTKPFETTNLNEDKVEEKIPKSTQTKNDKNNEPVEENFEGVTISNKIKNNAINNTPVDVNLQSSKSNKRHDSSTDANEGENKSNEEIKVNTMENVLKFMKVVADTISKNTRRGVGGKVKFLNELKTTLLSSIKDRIEATWPDDDSAPARRRSRSATARGHVEFPSSESALMTISFLTFAVFLIKLVLQVIHTYKNKAMMVAPLVVATSRRTVRKLRNIH